MPNYTIAKTFTFDASHALDDLPDGHQCKRLHGHTYRVEVILAGDVLHGPGFVVDYGDLDDIKQDIRDHLDHRHLGGAGYPGVFPFPPTAERLAAALFERWVAWHPQLVAIRVSETPATWAEYRPEPA